MWVHSISRLEVVMPQLSLWEPALTATSADFVGEVDKGQGPALPADVAVGAVRIWAHHRPWTFRERSTAA